MASPERFFRYDETSWMHEACPGRTDSVINHCWHSGITTYTSNPSQRDETCCYCGETVRVQDAPSTGTAFPLKREAHGPHWPPTTITFNASPGSVPSTGERET